eukprot:3314923-Rhodomonas_salina.3
MLKIAATSESSNLVWRLQLYNGAGDRLDRGSHRGSVPRFGTLPNEIRISMIKRYQTAVKESNQHHLERGALTRSTLYRRPYHNSRGAIPARMLCCNNSKGKVNAGKAYDNYYF